MEDKSTLLLIKLESIQKSNRHNSDTPTNK